ncbi:MAG: DUF1576 domain-containing protein [Lachnospiraceae bacterium]|nr:DUF1576 domain-containing protein [Lachnospiraceae bacterium]
MQRLREKTDGKELLLFTLTTNVLLYLMAFFSATPKQLVQGMIQIIVSRDALITDYFVLAGYGAAFLNAALVMSVCKILLLVEKIPFTGPTMAVLYINAGYALWGKNIVNIVPILLGTFLYAKLHHMRFGRYIYMGLFGTGLAPFVTEIIYLLPFSKPVNFVLAIVVGIFLGFVISPLSMHTASMHMGYNLFNVGFSAGLLAFVLVCLFRAFGLQSQSVLIWQEGVSHPLAVGMYVYFVIAVLMGLWINRGKIDKLISIVHRPGRAVSDFVLMDGPGASLMNMGLVGIIGLTYILLIGGDLSGPVVGAVWMSFGFAAFGVHVKNYWPVLLGVYAFSFFSQYDVTMPGIQLAAIFAVGLAPIAGQFGVLQGVLAGMLHSAIVMCTADMYGGLNLYNNGFSAGCVAIFMVPVFESFMKQFENRRQKKRGRRDS